VKEKIKIDERRIRSFVIEDPTWEKLRLLSIINKEATSEILRKLIDEFLKQNQNLLAGLKNNEEQ
jgi:hypothetical protein